MALSFAVSAISVSAALAGLARPAFSAAALATYVDAVSVEASASAAAAAADAAFDLSANPSPAAAVETGAFLTAADALALDDQILGGHPLRRPR